MSAQDQYAAHNVIQQVSTERDALRAQVRAVESLFSGGPDTPCRTVWDDGIECVSVPLADLRAVLDGHYGTTPRSNG